MFTKNPDAELSSQPPLRFCLCFRVESQKPGTKRHPAGVGRAGPYCPVPVVNAIEAAQVMSPTEDILGSLSPTVKSSHSVPQVPRQEMAQQTG